MIRFNCPLPPSKNRPDLKRQFALILRNFVYPKSVTAGTYCVKLKIFGKWYKPDGSFKRRDTNNLVPPLLDAMAKVFSFDDVNFNGGLEYGPPIESESEYVEVTLLAL